MIDWLSDWLRSIIAVILLAVFVELLMPGKAMQRYARLVIGLFLLLTIMTPLLKIVQGNFEQQVMSSFRRWEIGAAQTELKMPSLEDIRKEAEKLNSERAIEASELTERLLEEQIAGLVEKNAGVGVDSVDVSIAEGEPENYMLQSAVITIEPLAAPEDSPLTIAPVAVDVAVPPVEATAGGSEGGDSDEAVAERGRSDEGASEAWMDVPAQLDGRVRKLLYDTWGIESRLVTIRQPADDGGTL